MYKASKATGKPSKLIDIVLPNTTKKSKQKQNKKVAKKMKQTTKKSKLKKKKIQTKTGNNNDNNNAPPQNNKITACLLQNVGFFDLKQLTTSEAGYYVSKKRRIFIWYFV